MIISTPYKVGETVSIKLTSGEEMVAHLENETATEVIVRKPLMLIAGQNGAAFAPFMFTVDAETKIPIKLANVICIVKTDTDAASAYLQSTTSIQTVS
jgi:hypothetical protein